MRRVQRCLSALVAVSSLGCAGAEHDAGTTSPAAVPATVVVALSTASIEVGQSATGTATVLDHAGRPIDGGVVSWSTSSASIATVNMNGVVTGTAPGQTIVIATVGNIHGQLQVTVTARAVAPSQPVRIVAGGGHTCWSSSEGAASCWGSGSSGQLGNGSSATTLLPVPVAGSLVLGSLAAGEFSTCGLSITGVAYCWGQVAGDQSSDVTNAASRTTPAPVPGSRTFASLTTGYYHACGLTEAGAAYCWGDGVNGQLGDGTTVDYRSVPAPVIGDIRFARLTGGYWHTCGLSTQGIAYCWGNNNWAQLGDSTRTAHAAPAPLQSDVRFSMLAAGGRHTCGLSTAGAAYCWGWNAFGQLGDATTVLRLSPVAVVAPTGISFSSIVAGWYHTCALTAVGAAYCWGWNPHGQLGDGATTDRATPVAVAGGLTFSSLALGVDHTCGVTTAGIPYCWGSNASGQIGDGTTVDRSAPVPVHIRVP